MSDNKVIPKFQSRVPGIGNPDKVETALQFLLGAHFILFPSTWQILLLFSISLYLNVKIDVPIARPTQKERERNGISGPGKELCQEDLMGSPKSCHDAYSGLDLIRGVLWSFNLKKKNSYFLELLQRNDYLATYCFH